MGGGEGESEVSLKFSFKKKNIFLLGYFFLGFISLRRVELPSPKIWFIESIRTFGK